MQILRIEPSKDVNYEKIMIIFQNLSKIPDFQWNTCSSDLCTSRFPLNSNSWMSPTLDIGRRETTPWKSGTEDPEIPTQSRIFCLISLVY